jgi:hypothetical protein
MLLVAAGAETIQILDNGLQKTIALQAHDQLRILGNNNTLTVHGEGGTIALLGNNNDVNLQGHGQAVDVMGNNNKVVIDAELPRLALTGNNNKIRIVRRKGRSQPSLDRVGSHNEVTFEDAK